MDDDWGTPISGNLHIVPGFSSIPIFENILTASHSLDVPMGFVLQFLHFAVQKSHSFYAETFLLLVKSQFQNMNILPYK